MFDVKPPIRLLATAAALSAWLILLLVGWTLGGAIHLLLIAALAAFPWRELGSTTAESEE